MRAAAVTLALLALATTAEGTVHVSGRLHVSGQHVEGIYKGAPDWTTPRMALPAAPSCSLVSSPTDTSRVTLDCGTWSPTVYTSVVLGGLMGFTRNVVMITDADGGKHAQVSDTFTNNDASTIGAHYRNFFGSTSAYVHLAGQLMPTGLDKPAAWNPTAFSALGRVGLGLVAEDKVLRIQSRVDYKNGSVGIKSDLLCLAPTNSVTLVWSIWPTATNSYWDFINRVRVAWSVNNTVVGPYTWFAADTVNAYDSVHGVGALAQTLATQNIAVAVLGGGWVDPLDGSSPKVIGFGNYVMSSFFASYRARIQGAIAALHTARPGIKVILYFNAARDSTPSNPYGADSDETDLNNNPISSTFGGAFTQAWNTFPTSTNSYGTQMLITAAAMTGNGAGQLGADGVFSDEDPTYGYTSSAAAGSPASPPLTFNVSDGNTCFLRTNGTVTAQLGEVNLLAESARLSMSSSFPFILRNGPALLPSFTARSGDMFMVEIESNTGFSGFANLSTPLGYNSSFIDWGHALSAVSNAVLPVAYCAVNLDSGTCTSGGITWQALPRMFPCTPQFLQSDGSTHGTIRCSERVVTTTSGIQGPFTGDAQPAQYLYDSSGIEHAGMWTVTGSPRNWRVTTALAANQMAIVVD